jgi:two-component system cell cycle response regulator
MTIIESSNIEIFNGIFWVGSGGVEGNLHCNPYLLIDGDEAVLFDPGSILDFEIVFSNVTKLVPLEKIKYVVLHHQDPDFCSSVTLFEQKGAKFKIATHWRTQTLIKFYGIKSEYYILNENNFRLTLKSGRELQFIQTPYLHFPGAVATYDRTSKILFSSDLFGAISHNWSLFAKEDYIEGMKTFHEHYMPSNDILRPVMEVFLTLDISIIAPQHGSIINHDIKKHIRVLRDLECGTLLMPIKRELSKSGGYIGLCSLVLQRFAAVFDKQELLDVVKDIDMSLDIETLEITDYNYLGPELWNIIFNNILLKKGINWLVVIEPFIRKVCAEYKINLPEVFETNFKKSFELAEENKQLKEMNEYLKKNVKETMDRLIHCPITGLYNYDFFKNHLISILEEDNKNVDPALIAINIDNLAKIRFTYGDPEVDGVLKTTVLIIKEIIGESEFLFRIHGAAFVLYISNTNRGEVTKIAENIRNAIAFSEKYIENVTVSLGVVLLDEIENLPIYNKHQFEVLYEIAMQRVKLARNRGKNIVCSNSEVRELNEDSGKILLVDTDEISIDVVKTFFENLKYEIFVARDGEEALRIAENELPDAIISEIMIPKRDAFLLRERLLLQSQTKEIPFILVSHLKNEDTIKRAFNLKIENYLKKPFMLSELSGIIKLKVKGDAYQ